MRTTAAILLLILAAGYKGPIPFRPPYGKKLFTLPRVLDRRKEQP